jgi:hypothetical protein
MTRRWSRDPPYDADGGIHLGSSAFDDDCRGNTFVRTTTPVLDEGVGNVY